jgi:hypothetical protein
MANAQLQATLTNKAGGVLEVTEDNHVEIFRGIT